MKTYKIFFIILIVLAILSPAGVYLPHLFKARGAWGEGGVQEVKSEVGYIPQKMAEVSATVEKLWKAPFPDYSFSDSYSNKNINYIISAFLGIIFCGGIGYFVTRWLSKKQKNEL
jgi:cobalt/nickel transport system permease protein